MVDREEFIQEIENKTVAEVKDRLMKNFEFKDRMIAEMCWLLVGLAKYDELDEREEEGFPDFCKTPDEVYDYISKRVRKEMRSIETATHIYSLQNLTYEEARKKEWEEMLDNCVHYIKMISEMCYLLIECDKTDTEISSYKTYEEIYNYVNSKVKKELRE